MSANKCATVAVRTVVPESRELETEQLEQFCGGTANLSSAEVPLAEAPEGTRIPINNNTDYKVCGEWWE